MLSSDVTRIAACIADDWVLVTPEVGVVSRAHILHVIASGELSHDTMTKDVTRVKVYGPEFRPRMSTGGARPTR